MIPKPEVGSNAGKSFEGMRVLHILQNYEPSKGGTQFLFKNISEYLVKHFRDHVTVCTTDSLYDPSSKLYQRLPKRDEVNGVHINRFSFARSQRKVLLPFKRILFKLGLSSGGLDRYLRVPESASMKKFIDGFEADVVCASSIFYSYIDYAIYRHQLSKPKPFVLMGAIHFDDEDNISIPPHYLNRIANADKYIANTKFEKDCLVRLGVPSAKINVIGCGVNISDFGKTLKKEARAMLGLSESDFVVGYVGRFAPNKDLKTLIKAFEVSAKANWKLVLAGGTNSHLDEIRHFVAAFDKSLGERIAFLVDFDEARKEFIYSSLDVFVSASWSESFGIVFLEAWASKLPVIGTTIGAIRSVITDGEDGRLFPVSDHVELSKMLLYYFDHPDARVSHGNKGLAKIKGSYTWEIITGKYRETYVEAISIFNHRHVDAA